jgi:hypothetical protein
MRICTHPYAEQLLYGSIEEANNIYIKELFEQIEYKN